MPVLIRLVTGVFIARFFALTVASVAKKMQPDERDAKKDPKPILRKPFHFLIPYFDQ